MEVVAAAAGLAAAPAVEPGPAVAAESSAVPVASEPAQAAQAAQPAPQPVPQASAGQAAAQLLGSWVAELPSAVGYQDPALAAEEAMAAAMLESLGYAPDLGLDALGYVAAEPPTLQFTAQQLIYEEDGERMTMSYQVQQDGPQGLVLSTGSQEAGSMLINIVFQGPDRMIMSMAGAWGADQMLFVRR